MKFRTRTLLIALGVASVALAAVVGLRKGAKAAGFLFPNDAVYLTIDLPRPDLHPVALFAMQDGKSQPVSPYL